MENAFTNKNVWKGIEYLTVMDKNNYALFPKIMQKLSSCYMSMLSIIIMLCADVDDEIISRNDEIYAFEHISIK